MDEDRSFLVSLHNQKHRFVIGLKTNFHCAYCGEKPENPQIDHITPITDGGLSEFDNLIFACRKCNNLKLNHSIDVFRHKFHRSKIQKEFGAPVFSLQQILWLKLHGFDYMALLPAEPFYYEKLKLEDVA